MRSVLLIIVLFLPVFGLAQDKKVYQFDLRTKPYYTESNRFFIDSGWSFNQIIAFDMPFVIDEEQWDHLLIKIQDTVLFVKKGIFRFNTDSLTATFYQSRWIFLDPKRYSITGQIEFVSLTQEGILLNMNILVKDLQNSDQFIYKGQRVFCKKTTLREFEDYWHAD